MPKKRSETAEHMKRLRESFGMNQAGFSKLMNLGQSKISEMEAGKRFPSPETYLRLGNKASFPDNLWFWQKAGLDIQVMQSAMEKRSEALNTPPETSEFVRVPRVRKTSQGMREVGAPLAMPAEFIPHPASTYCLIFRRAGRDNLVAVVDTIDRDAKDLSPFLGHTVLVEFAPRSERKDYFGWPEGLAIGFLYLCSGNPSIEGTPWSAEFLPVDMGQPLTGHFPVGFLLEKEYKEFPSVPVSAPDPISIVEKFNEYYEAHKHEDAYQPGLGGLSKGFVEAIARAGGMRPLIERLQRVATEVWLASGCTILGRVILWSKPKAVEK